MIIRRIIFMLVTLNEIMKIAEEKKIAIGAFNAPNLESLRAVLAAAEELKLPVIIQVAQCHEIYTPLSIIPALSYTVIASRALSLKTYMKVL